MTPIQQLFLGAGGLNPTSDIFVDDNFRILSFKGTGNANNTITNGIDLRFGGMVISKRISSSGGDWIVNDTIRGTSDYLRLNKSDQEDSFSSGITSYNEDGITVGANAAVNQSNQYQFSYCFRKRKKFFTMVSYTGTGSNRSLSHDLNSVPGMIWIKRRNGSSQWAVYHKGLNNGNSPHNYHAGFPNFVQQNADSTYWNNTAPTSTHISLGTNSDVNASGGTYMAYIFGHNEESFGHNENSPMSYCGYYTGNGSGNGPFQSPNPFAWESQLILLNRVTGGTSNWYLLDNQRGLTGYDGGDEPWMGLGSDNASSAYNFLEITAEGFKIVQSNADINANGSQYIYYAIRAEDGITSKPVPEAASDVFSVSYGNNQSGFPQQRTNFKVSMAMTRNPSTNEVMRVFTRGIGNHGDGKQLLLGATTGSNAGKSGHGYFTPLPHDGFLADESNVGNDITYAWKESSGFTRVFYQGNGSSQQLIPHSLGATPEMIWVKNHSSANKWTVYHKYINSGTNAANYYINLNEEDGRVTDNQRWKYDPGSGGFWVGSNSTTNANYEAFVGYLFRSVTGISKVGYYNGSSSAQTISTGFQPKFLLVKQTSGQNWWLILDTVRGWGSGNDQYISTNSNNAQAGANFGEPTSNGFSVPSGGNAAINANGHHYIYYAHA